MADPQDGSEDDDEGAHCGQSPGKFVAKGIIAAGRTNILSTRKMKVGKFVFDLDLAVALQTRLLIGRGRWRRLFCFRLLYFRGAAFDGLRLPGFASRDLGLAQAGKIVGNGFFVV